MHMFQSIHSGVVHCCVLTDYTFSNQAQSTSILMSSISILLQIIRPPLWSLSVGVYHAMVQHHKNQCLTCYSQIAGGPTNKHDL